MNNNLYSKEDIIKNEINEFMSLINSLKVGMNIDYRILIHGGRIGNECTDGFIKLKKKILYLLNEPEDDCCNTLIYINNYEKNKQDRQDKKDKKDKKDK
jgi:hypothetical protein